MRNACGAYGMCTGVLGGVPSNKMRLYDKGVSCHPFGMPVAQEKHIKNAQEALKRRSRT